MARRIRITAGGVSAAAALNDTATATDIWESLPISARASTWGDEIYFGIPVQRDVEDGRETVDPGDLGYWPPGNAFCIFYGQTPASRRAGEIRPASAVSVVGRVDGDATVFKAVRSGQPVTVDRLED